MFFIYFGFITYHGFDSNRKKRRSGRSKNVAAENLESEFNKDTDDEYDNNDTMDNKKAPFEYSFIGKPVQADVKVESDDEQTEEVLDKSQQEIDSTPKRKKKKTTRKLPSRKLSTKKKKRKKPEQSSDDSSDSDDGDDLVEDSLSKITRTYANMDEKKYVLEKVYRTYNFLFPERQHICSIYCSNKAT